MSKSNPRRSIGKTTRFEVLRRDNFACRYCGMPAPLAVLQVDHVIPIALGGTNDRWNLTAACQDCNMGKRDGVPTPEVIHAVRTSEAYYQRSRGLSVYACEGCGIPMTWDEDEDEPTDCRRCSDWIIRGYEEGIKRGAAGWTR